MVDSSKILARARRVLDEEAQGILAAKESLQGGFVEAARAIAALPRSGRLVCSGVGKAGAIASKVSATFASIGVPSFVIHPTEAVHGDLGRITRDDVILFFSNSGQSLEVVRILPALHKVGCMLISITTNQESQLAKASNIVVTFPKLLEADPLGVAPTTSTTVMLALGDALAMAVLEERGVTADQFAQNHPAGTIGRSLMLVRDVMRSGDQFCTVPETMLMKEVLHQITITKGRPGAAAAIDPHGKLTGIFTDGNLRRCLEKDSRFLELPMSAVMTKGPKLILPDVLAEEALKLLSQHSIDQVVVVDEEGNALGMVDIQDVVQAG